MSSAKEGLVLFLIEKGYGLEDPHTLPCSLPSVDGLLTHTYRKAVWCSGLSTEQVSVGLNSLLLALSLTHCMPEASPITSLVVSFFRCGMGTDRAILLNEQGFYLLNMFIFSIDPRTVPCLSQE